MSGTKSEHDRLLSQGPAPPPSLPAIVDLHRRRSARRIQQICLSACALLVLWSWLWYYGPDNAVSGPTNTLGHRVPLEAHIMSKCPDAKGCLHDLVLPAMQQIEDKVNFTLSYIGSTTEKDDGVECKHGPTECLGNMLELCAASLYPDPKIYLGFTMCLTRDYEHIPERHLVEDCALEHGIDFGKLNACVSRDDGYAMELLRASVERTAAAGVKFSCTIRLNETIRCIMDGGEWKHCEGGHTVDDLVRDVKKLYGQ
ncbi:MAG: hypothetical protein M1833_005485 [Piccolia ochrophora]|nr:MAG: hypothetical protein M1833_005485 [Piccolia ochrophora]